MSKPKVKTYRLVIDLEKKANTVELYYHLTDEEFENILIFFRKIPEFHKNIKRVYLSTINPINKSGNKKK